MRRILRHTAIASAACAAASSPAVGAWLSPCATAHLVASWKHDGFWRTSAIVDPPKSVDGHQVRYLGRVRAAGGRNYKIYYDQSTNPETATRHSHTDLVVTTAGGRFLGYYEIADDELEPVGVGGADVLFNSSKAYGDRIHFGRGGAPPNVRLNDGRYEFDKAEGGKPDPGPRVSAYCRR